MYFNQVEIVEWPCGVICCVQSNSPGENLHFLTLEGFFSEDKYKRYQIKRLVEMDFFFFSLCSVVAI